MSTNEEHLERLRNHYLMVVPIGASRYAAIYPLMFTYAIITGDVADQVFLDDRWCYNDLATAMMALTEWQTQDFDDEPRYWHRHPNTGRRREYSDDGTFVETVIP